MAAASRLLRVDDPPAVDTITIPVSDLLEAVTVGLQASFSDPSVDGIKLRQPQARVAVEILQSVLTRSTPPDSILDLPIYELHYPDGSVARCYANGTVKGVPAGTMIVNRAATLIHYLLAQQEIALSPPAPTTGS